MATCSCLADIRTELNPLTSFSFPSFNLKLLRLFRCSAVPLCLDNVSKKVCLLKTTDYVVLNDNQLYEHDILHLLVTVFRGKKHFLDSLQTAVTLDHLVKQITA